MREQTRLRAGSLFAALLMVTTVQVRASHAADEFIEDYVNSKGGCAGYAPERRLMEGAEARPSPFGKPAYSWSEHDFDLLKEKLSSCLQSPRDRQMVLLAVKRRVDQAHLARAANDEIFENLKRECFSRPLTMQERYFLQKEQALRGPNQEAASYILSCAKGYVSEKTRVDNEMADKIRAVANGCSSRAFTDEETAFLQSVTGRFKRDADDALGCQRYRTKQIEDKKRADEQKRQEEIATEHFVSSLPSACRTAIQTSDEWDNQDPDAAARFSKAQELSHAGLNKEACTMLTELGKKADDARFSLNECYRSISAATEERAVSFRDSVLQRAGDMRDFVSDAAKARQEAQCASVN